MPYTLLFMKKGKQQDVSAEDIDKALELAFAMFAYGTAYPVSLLSPSGKEIMSDQDLVTAWVDEREEGIHQISIEDSPDADSTEVLARRPDDSGQTCRRSA